MCWSTSCFNVVWDPVPLTLSRSSPVYDRCFVTKIRVFRAGIETVGPLVAASVTSSVREPEGNDVTVFAVSLRFTAT